MNTKSLFQKLIRASSCKVLQGDLKMGLYEKSLSESITIQECFVVPVTMSEQILAVSSLLAPL